MAKTKNRFDVTPSSGNVFADLGLPRADEKQTKVRLAVAINRIIPISGSRRFAPRAVCTSTSPRSPLYPTTASLVFPSNAS